MVVVLVPRVHIEKGLCEMVSAVFVPTNSRAPRCIDGRKAIMFVEWDKDAQKWVVAKRGEQAGKELGPQFLGAGLMFVRILQEVANMSLVAAFERVEHVFSVLGWTPQIHMDDHHGEYDFLKMSDEEVVETVVGRYIEGCGFAKYAWGDEATDVLHMAVERKWRIQILTGEHEEKGASKNLRASTTFKTPLRGGKTQFNIDMGDTRLVLMLIAFTNPFQTDFYQKAVEWVHNTYDDVVIALGGVSKASEIKSIY